MYYKKSECNELTTKITAKTRRGELWDLELEDTIFYPEGGGQPADRGWIDGIRVLDVQKNGNRILHTLEQAPDKEGVRLELDRSHRDHFRIQHTGQHLVSALLLKYCGARTLSVHLGEEECGIETDREEIPREELYRIEEKAARLIAAGIPVTSQEVPDRKALETYKLRRSTDKTENIRLVSIGEEDVTPCGGLHADSTAELGMIKYTGRERVRGHIRLKWKIGAPAREDYRRRLEQTEQISTLLSTPSLETAERLKTVLEEKKAEDRRLNLLEDAEARRISRALSSSVTSYPPLVIRKMDDCPASLFRKICRELSEEGTLSFLLCSEEGEKLNWALHLPFHREQDFNDFKETCLPLIDGRGGGRSPPVAGRGTGTRKSQRVYGDLPAAYSEGVRSELIPCSAVSVGLRDNLSRLRRL